MTPSSPNASVTLFVFQDRIAETYYYAALMETAFCRFSSSTSPDRLAYPRGWGLCSAYHLLAIQAWLLCGVTPQDEQQDCAGTGLLGTSTPQLWEEAKPVEAAITTSPWNPVSCPVQPCSVIELHSSGKAGIPFPQHLQLQLRSSCNF